MYFLLLLTVAHCEPAHLILERERERGGGGGGGAGFKGVERKPRDELVAN